MEKYPRMVGHQFDKNGFDQKENMLLFVCSEAVESKPVKLETSHTVMLPPPMTVLCIDKHRHL